MPTTNQDYNFSAPPDTELTDPEEYKRMLAQDGSDNYLVQAMPEDNMTNEMGDGVAGPMVSNLDGNDDDISEQLAPSMTPRPPGVPKTE